MNLSPSDNMSLDVPCGSDKIENVLKKQCYVDKTKYIHMLLTSKATIVVLRPRRFGKTLFVDTIETICKGEKHKYLFDNLYIGSTDYAWKMHPVIRLDFSNFNSYNLKAEVIAELFNIGKSYGYSIETSSIKVALRDLFAKLEGIEEKNTIVCLFDEYDYAALNPKLSPEDKAKVKQNPDLEAGLLDKVRQKVKETMKDIFIILKSNSGKCQLQFVTGITKYGLSDIFSAANHLEDFTLTSFASTIFGFTRVEVETRFNKQIDLVVRELNKNSQNDFNRDSFWKEVNTMYNGYRFCGHEDVAPVYSPWSILQLFSQKSFAYFWAESGNPTVLIYEMMKHLDKCEDFLYNMDSSRVEIESLDLVCENPTKCVEALLFQTGYLTIESYNMQTMRYTLKFANEDAKGGFQMSFTQCINNEVNKYMAVHKINIKRIMNSKQVDELVSIVNSAFSSIPYLLSSTQEKHFHSKFHMFFMGCGLTMDDSMLPLSESLTSSGRSDIIIKLPNVIYIIELQYNAESAEVALRQIKKKKYFEPFRNVGKDLVLLGLNFTDGEHIIKDHKFQIISKENLFNFAVHHDQPVENELEVTNESMNSPGVTSNSGPLASLNDQDDVQESRELQSGNSRDNQVFPQQLPITGGTAGRDASRKRKNDPHKHATIPSTQKSVADQGS